LRCACIDIGSNTTRLLVAERAGDTGFREVLARRMFVPLAGVGGGTIGADTIGIVAAVVAAHAAAAHECGAVAVDAVATAAIRQAADREELCAAVYREAGVPVRVLSDREEARLAFAGATAGLSPAPAGLLGVADIGGGSSELVTGTPTAGVTWFSSAPVGSGVLTARHVRDDPPSRGQVAALRAGAEAAFDGMRAPRPVAAYAVGGSATSLRRLCGEELTPEALDRALETIVARPVRETAERLALARERVRLLPAGLLLLRAAGAAFGGVPLRVAQGGLREGVVLEHFTRERGG
jgi:exopolyphosphatase / guanosine-5'-triphosphate,3'-diphosphate pyrophosphatase